MALFGRPFPILAAFVVTCSLLEAQSSPISLEVQPTTVQPHETVTLRWTLPATVHAFITHIGVVSSSGTGSIPVEGTTTLTLITQVGGKTFVRTATVFVTGARGGADYPAEDAFRLPRHYRTTSALPDTLNQVFAVLQNDLGFSVHMSHSTNRTVFVTNFSERTFGQQDHTVRGRRVAYLVSIQDPQSADVDVTISTLIQRQLRLERTWRPDPNDDGHRIQAEYLAKKLGFL